MGGKRFRWIYFQLGQLALLSLGAFVAALAVAIPVSGAPTRAHQALLRSAEMSVMLWVPSLLFWMLMKRGRKPRPLRALRERRVLQLARNLTDDRKREVLFRRRRRRQRHVHRHKREDRYEHFVPLFMMAASIILAVFYGIFADATTLKTCHADFAPQSGVTARIVATAFAIGLVGVLVGATLRNRNTFLVLFGFISASSLCLILTRTHLVNPEAPWQRIGFNIVSRFADIGAFAIGIAAGIFVRELIRYRRRELRRRVT